MVGYKTTTTLNFNQSLLKLYFPSYTYKGFKYKYFQLVLMLECFDIFVIIVISSLKPSVFIP